MQYINYFILFLIYLNILFSSLIISRILIGKIAQKYTSIKQYQITNWYLTISCVYFYISFPILGLYGFRFYNINKALDLKIFYENIINYLKIEILFPKIFIIIIIIIILINILLCMVIMYKYLNNQMFNVYIYIKYHIQDRDTLKYFINNYINNYYKTDIISYYIIKFNNYLNKRWAYHKLSLKWEKNPDTFSLAYKKKQALYYDYCKKRPWYHLHVIFINIIENKCYTFFILFSPIIIILYDCIFNNWVITHVYFYLLIYIPVMLFRRFTILNCEQNNLIGTLIWDILYKKESCIYALPKDHRKLFDIYIANGIKTVDLGPPALMDFDISWFISTNAQFIYNQQENLYYNRVDKFLVLLPDKRLVYRHTDYDSQLEVDEEWYPIVVKYHYHDDNNYEIILDIN